MNQRDFVYGGCSAGIGKRIKAVVRDSAGLCPGADGSGVRTAVAERSVVGQPAAAAGGQEEGQPAGQPSPPVGQQD